MHEIGHLFMRAWDGPEIHEFHAQCVKLGRPAHFPSLSCNGGFSLVLYLVHPQQILAPPLGIENAIPLCPDRTTVDFVALQMYRYMTFKKKLTVSRKFDQLSHRQYCSYMRFYNHIFLSWNPVYTLVLLEKSSTGSIWVYNWKRLLEWQTVQYVPKQVNSFHSSSFPLHCDYTFISVSKSKIDKVCW